MEHSNLAGLPVFDGDLSIKQAQDHRYVSRLIENTKPKWPPGTATKYHAVTYGWLLDQLIRRADPAKRGIGQFYREEIQVHMKDKDFYLGSHPQQYYRVARIVQPTIAEKIKAVCTNYQYLELTRKTIIDGGKCELCKAANNYPSWMAVLSDQMPYNNPAVQEVENTAALEKMISEKTWKEINMPTEPPRENIFPAAGHGFFYEQHPIQKNSYTMNHPGNGMQMLIFDPHSKVVLVVLRNGLLWNFQELEKVKAVFDGIIKIINNGS